jgi:hypothetical protein
MLWSRYVFDGKKRFPLGWLYLAYTLLPGRIYAECSVVLTCTTSWLVSNIHRITGNKILDKSTKATNDVKLAVHQIVDVLNCKLEVRTQTGDSTNTRAFQAFPKRTDLFGHLFGTFQHHFLSTGRPVNVQLCLQLAMSCTTGLAVDELGKRSISNTTISSPPRHFELVPPYSKNHSCSIFG